MAERVEDAMRDIGCKPQVVTVPIHRGRDLGIKTVPRILKQAGIEP